MINNMKKYLTKKEYIIFVVALIVTLLSFSYAFFMSFDAFGNNIATTQCFKLSFVDSNDINLDKAYPLSEQEGSQLTPYTFTIKNVCNKKADYQVNIETLNTTTLDTEYVRMKLDNNDSMILKRNELITEYVNQNVKEGRKIAEGSLSYNEERTYNLRLWVDEQSTVDQSENKIYRGKVTVSATPNNEVHDVTIAYIVDGLPQDVPPGKNDGYLVKNIECTNATGTWDYDNWGLLTTSMIGKVTCDIEFEEATYNIVQKWLATADIDKNYTTISEVLNDTTTLSTLINNSASCDYLKNSTDWVNAVTSNENAMTYIGNNAYCGNVIVDDNNWINGIKNSSYFEKVFNVKVPTMTSNTAPEGQCFGSFIPQQGGFWYVFDKQGYNVESLSVTRGTATSSQGVLNDNIGYKFVSQKVVKFARIWFVIGGNIQLQTTLYLEGSNDNTNYTVLGEVSSNDYYGILTIDASSNTDSYQYYRIRRVSTGSFGYRYWYNEVEFYGREALN